MRHIRIFIPVACSLLSVIIFLVLVTARMNPPARTSYQPIEDAYMPGNLYFSAESCNWQHHLREKNRVVCQKRIDFDRRMWITTNPNNARIISVGVGVDDITIGELLIIWGLPMGYTHQGSLIYLYWPGRYVFLVTPAFTPRAAVNYVGYTTEPMTYQPWRGFTPGGSSSG